MEQEALGNVLAHRDYCLPDPTRITVFADRIEFHSPGALPTGSTLAGLRRGDLAPRWRNQTLAWVFMKLGLAQGEGQGLATIREQMRLAGRPQPRYIADEVSVTCTLRAHPLTSKGALP
ncbi:MAG: hypothetical protein NT029_20370 [Armatimonadetes bacterium]|nr:hypothetical protein [Armatimonadota bacterium]